MYLSVQIQNSAVRVLTGTIRRQTPVLVSLHIDFKVILFVFKALHGLVPACLSDMLQCNQDGPSDPLA